MKKSLLLLLFAFAAASTTTVFGQNNLKAAYKAPSGVPDFLNVCGDADLATVVVSTEGLSSATRKNIQVTVELFKGVELLALDAAATSAGVVLVNNLNRNRPVLSLPNLSPSGLKKVEIGLMLNVNCEYTDTISSNNSAVVFDKWKMSYTLGSSNLTETDALAEYRNAFKVPVFTIAVDNSAPPARVGDCYSRNLTMANSALEGFADTVVYQNLQGDGVSIKKIYVGGLEIPFTKQRIGNDTLITAYIWGAWLQTATKNGHAGNGNIFLDPDESLQIREDLCIVSCTKLGLSKHTVGWGCRGYVCQTAVANGFARLGDGVPAAKIEQVSALSPKTGYCKPGVQTVRYTNNGQASDPGFADMTDLTIKIGMGNTIATSVPGFKIDSMTIAGRPIVPPVSSLDLKNNPLFSTDPDGAGGLADLDGDGFFDDLPQNGTFDVQCFWHFDCTNATQLGMDSLCFNNYLTAWNAQLGYRDPCNFPQTKSLPNFGGVQNANEDVSNCVDPDAFVNDTFHIQHVETRGVRVFEKACDGSEFFQVFVKLPQGVKPVISSFKIFKNNASASLALTGSEMRHDTLYTFWDASSSFIGAKYDINLYFIPDCSTAAGQISLPIGFEHVCPSCDCRHTWYCEKIKGPLFHKADPPCAGAPICVLGTNTVSFEANRTTFGFTSTKYDKPFDPAKANKKVAIPCDSIRMTLRSVVGQTPLTDSLGAIIRYDNIEHLKDTSEIFFFGKGVLQIRHGGSLFSCPIDSNDLFVEKTDTAKTLHFDFAHCLDSLHLTLVAGDSVNFIGDFMVNPNGPFIKNFRKVPNFRGWTFATVGGVDYSCDSYGDNFEVAKNITAFAQPGGSDFPKGCSNTPLQYRLITTNNGFKDFFGLEYRQAVKIDSLVFDYDTLLLQRFQGLGFEVSIPGHPKFGNNFFAVPPFSPSTDGGHYVCRFDTLTQVPALNNVQSYAFNFRIKLTPTCEAEFGSALMNNQFKLEPRAYYHDRFYASVIGDGSCVRDAIDGSKQVLNYNDVPDVAFSSVTNPSLLLTADTATWDIKQCNLSTKSDASLTWLAAVFDSTELEILNFEEVSDPSNPVVFPVKKYGAGKVFATTPSLLKNVDTNAPSQICNTFRVKALVKKCGTSDFTLHMGWNCAPYPDPNWNPDLYPPCGDDTLGLSVTTLDPQVDATIINQPPTFANVCDTIPLEVLIKNTGQGALYDVVSQIQLPLTGATLVPGSLQIAYPSNAPFQPVLGLPTYKGVSPRGKLYEYEGFDSLNLYLAQHGLKGFDPLNVDSTNQFILKYQFTTGCEFHSGSLSFYAFAGEKICAEPSNLETGESLPIYFNGLTPPVGKNFGCDLAAGSVFSAGSSMANLQLLVWNKTATPTDEHDKVSIKLPAGVSFQNGSSMGLAPSGWSPMPPTIQQVDSIQIVTWCLPVGLGLNDTARLGFIALSPTVSCSDELEAGLSTLRFAPVGCNQAQINCEMAVITTDGGEKFVPISVGQMDDFLGDNLVICAGDSAQMDAGGPWTQVIWTPENGLDDPTSATPKASPDSTTTYFVSAFDATGCLHFDEITVSVLPILNILSKTDDPTCGATNGQIILNVTNGSGDFSFEWNPPVSTTNEAKNLSAGDYEITVTDNATGCSALQSASLMSMSSSLAIALTPTNATTVNPSSGSIFVNITGGQNPISIIWSGPTSGQHLLQGGSSYHITGLFSGSYEITVTDASGCAAAKTVFVDLTVINNLSLTATATPDTSCCGGAGLIQALAAGGDGNYTFTWQPAVSNSNIAAGVTAGDYFITVTDGQGLTATTTVTVADACQCDFMPDVLFEPSGIEALCLPIPLIYIDDIDLKVNGVPYTGPLVGCDLDSVVYYGFGFTPGKGLAGPYRLEKWSCNGMTFSNFIFNDIFELADYMSLHDPFGFWMADAQTQAIYGGDIDQAVYGQMKIRHLPTWTPITIGVNYTQFAYGTTIFVQPFSGKVVITGYDSTTCCSDMTCVLFMNPCDDLVPQEPFAVWQGDQKICLPIPFSTHDSTLYFLDRKPIGLVSSCDGGNGTQINFQTSNGQHELIVIDLAHLCADTVPIIVFGNLPTPQLRLLSTDKNTSILKVCMDTTELLGPIAAVLPCGGPMNGLATMNPTTGCFDYSPNADFIGNDSMCVILQDVWGLTDTTFFKIAVNPKTPPSTDLFYLTTPFQTPIQNICAIVNDIQNINLTLSVCDQPAHGTMEITGLCSTYTPNNGFSGLDTTCILLCNSLGQCDTTRIFITVLPAPKKDTVFLTTDFGKPTAQFCLDRSELSGSTFDLTACDSISNGNILLLNDSCMVFTPAPQFVGQTTVCLQLCDNLGVCDTTIFIITVLPTPTRDTLFLQTTVNQSIQNICSSTSQLSGGPFTFSICQNTPNGSLAQTAPLCVSFTPANNFIGQTTGCLSVCDAQNTCDTTILIIKVNAPAAPKKDTLFLQTPENQPLTNICVSPDELGAGPYNLVVCLPPPTNGSVQVTSMFCATFTPAPNFVGTATACLRLCDAALLADTTVLIIQVTPVAPTIPKKDTLFLQTPENQPLTNICVSPSELGAGPYNLVVCLPPPTNGSVQVTSMFCATFTPAPNFVGTATACLRLCDAALLADTTVLIIQVTPVSTPVLPKKDSLFLQTEHDFPIVVCLDTTELTVGLDTVTLCQNPSNGAFVSLGDNCILYFPDAGFFGDDSFCVLACDSAGICDTTIVFVHVIGPPVKDTIFITLPNDMNATVCADLTMLTTILDSFSFCETPQNGSAVPTGGGCVLYTPTAGFVGGDQFCLVACDQSGLCDTTIVIVNIIAPITTTLSKDTISLEILNDTTALVCVDLSELTTGVASFGFCENPSNGSASMTGGVGCVLYSPNSNFVGTETFCLVACDSTGLCDTTIVEITVKDAPPQPPKITTDTLFITVKNDSTATICVDLGELNGLISSSSVCGSPSNGIIGSINGNPCFSYSPNSDFVGTDTFCLVVCNAQNLCDTTIVIATVEPGDSVPNGASVTKDTIFLDLFENMLSQQFCLDLSELVGSPASIAYCDKPDHGKFILAGISCFTYVPFPSFIGKDSACIVICDDTGLCDTTIVYINVVAPVAPPTRDTIYATTDLNTPTSICLDLSQLAGPPVSLNSCGDPSNGTLAGQVGQPLCLIYTPSNGFIGLDEACVVVCDGLGICDTTSIFILVETPDTNGVFPNKDTLFVSVPQDSTLQICLDTTELDGPFVSITQCGGLSIGTILLSGNSPCFNYTPNPSFIGVETICLAVCDASGPCDTTIVVIMVTEPDTTQPPISPKKDTLFLTTTVNTIVQGCVDESELSGPINSFSLCQTPSNGTVGNALGNPCFTYTPSVGFVGLDTFCVVVCDQSGLCDTTIVFVNVKPDSITPPTGPKLDTLYFSTTINTSVNGCIDLSQLGGSADNLFFCGNPTNGTTVLQGNSGCFTYTPDSNFVGLDSFCLIGCTIGVGCDTTYIFVLTETPPDSNGTFHVPADTIYLTTPQDVPLTNICFSFDSLTTDIASFNLCGLPANGSIGTAGAPCLTYFPNAGFVGLDNFCVTACDSTGLCDTVFVVVLVTPVLPPPPPVLDTILVNVPFGEPSDTICLDLTQIGGVATSFNICGLPNDGELVQTSGFCLIYTPDSLFFGNDTACIVVCNGSVCDTTVVIFTVAPPDCGIFPADSLTIFVDAGDSATLCLHLPLDQVPQNQIELDGQLYTLGYAGCNFDTMFAYTYFTVPGFGHAGPYFLDHWFVGNDTFSGQFNDIGDLVDSMNVWNPGCNWTLDPTTLTIRGGCLSQFYGNIEVTQLSTQGIAVIELNLFLNPQGTQIKVPEGSHVLTISGSSGCTDSIFVNVLLNAQLTIDTLVFVGETDTLCLSDYGFTAANVDSIDVDLCPDLSGTNVDFQFDTLTNCLIYTGVTPGVDTFCIKIHLAGDSSVNVKIIVTTLQTLPCHDFLGQNTLTLAAASCDSVSVTACTNLPFFVSGDYLITDNGASVISIKCPPSQSQPTVDLTGVLLKTAGLHSLVFNNPLLGCADTLTVLVTCQLDTNSTTRDTIFVGQSDTICVGSNFIASLENICPSLSGQNVNFQIDTVNLCLIYTGLAVGTDTACLVICDTLGFCDTTIFIVTVVPKSGNLPPIAVNDTGLTTTMNTPINIPVLGNDTLNGTLKSLTIWAQPTHGSAIVSGQNILFTPNQDYCDSNGLDSLEYVLCNQVGCDSAWVYFTVMCTEIQIFDGFSPNGDGMNETFTIEGIFFFPQNDVQVFNRWGNEVYQKNGYRNEWDGTWNGKKLPDGVYFYIFHDGKGHEWSGPVVIRR